MFRTLKLIKINKLRWPKMRVPDLGGQSLNTDPDFGRY